MRNNREMWMFIAGSALGTIVANIVWVVAG